MDQRKDLSFLAYLEFINSEKLLQSIQYIVMKRGSFGSVASIWRNAGENFAGKLFNQIRKG